MDRNKIILILSISMVLSMLTAVEVYVYFSYDPTNNLPATIQSDNTPQDVAYLREQLNQTTTDLKNTDAMLSMYEDTYGKLFYKISVPSCSVIPDTFYLVNNITARNISWEELSNFLYYKDFTDMKIYNEYSQACGDYAEELHNNAEAHGIRAAYVQVEFEDGSVGHAMNAFMTEDYGLQFIDDTGSSSADDTSNHDKMCLVEKGRPLRCTGITGKAYGATGIIKTYEIYW